LADKKIISEEEETLDNGVKITRRVVVEEEEE
jgi:hypothetical protein